MTIMYDAKPTDTDRFEVYVFGAMKPIRDRDLKLFFFSNVIGWPLSLLGLAAGLLWFAYR